ncbi:MAG: hypothetical protein P8L68_07630 [Paracoccaceae bacterium]|nr:hypothetical protein [Paracoccaceae bacterium]MDG2258348.1 hypothetical protein [Paracoccaceae bacterium]
MARLAASKACLVAFSELLELEASLIEEGFSLPSLDISNSTSTDVLRASEDKLPVFQQAEIDLRKLSFSAIGIDLRR